MNIEFLLDLLSSSTGDLWLELSDELLEAGYVWELTVSRPDALGHLQEVYRLLDLAGSGYFD